MRRAGWEFARPDSQRVLAFVYSAVISLEVEESCASINPALSVEDLAAVLTRRPDWLTQRPEYLRTGWPSTPVRCRSDLEQYALAASKARLAFGARVPDGSHIEMVEAFASLFPQVTSGMPPDPTQHEAWRSHVTIETNGAICWGYGGPLVREGRPIPIPDVNFGSLSAFGVFLQNQMRLDLQRRIEDSR